MARFTIYSPNGGALYEGTPTFTGQYMKPGLLEFREVALPALVDLVPGCYVDYTRTGYRYRIYTVPQLKKQARSNSYGGAFVYQSVQLYDASKMLEYCPFRDLVTGDNRIHFSTQPSISTFEGCDGLARRFEACLQDQYGTNSWAVRIATQAENPNLYELMLEPREFTVSGMNILECLNKVYEIWPEVGWIYKVENGKDTIVIGGGGLNPNEETYAYGKGFGLTSLTRVSANADEIANRIFAYGSSRNMLPCWYNSQDIKDAESVDIQNLMIPVSEWGLTDGERDAAKAYVEDDASIAKNGLRPSTVYFDGSGEYPEIYPTLRETTIGMVRTALGSSSARYYPSTAVYTNPADRVDKLLSAQSTFDSGKAGADGKSSTDVDYIPYDHSGAATPITIAAQSVHTEAFASGTIAITGTGRLNIDVSYPGIGILTGCGAVYLDFSLGKVHGGATTTIYTQRVVMNPGDAGSYSVPEGKISYTGNAVFETGDSLAVNVNLVLDNRSGAADASAYLTNASGTMTVKAANHREKTFTISLRQVGFDINEQSDLGNGKTIAMRSGDCVGRSFAIKTVQYNESGDCWNLECWRSEDESLSQWFPNSQFGVAAGDEFVLLDIAMPDIYVQMAEQKLLTAANDLLDDSAVERWQYMPEIDAKYMVENGVTIRAGEYMSLLDIDAEDITPTTITYFRASGGGYFYTTDNRKTVLSIDPGSVITAFVDAVTINEGESAIPTYKVTLRDRKKKTWTESQSPDSSSSKSVGSITTETTTTPTVVGDSFFELDEDGNVTLKSQYQNLWVPGWMAAGGVGTKGGGGGGVSFLKELIDVYHNDSNVLRADGTGVQPGDALVYDTTHGWVAAVQSGGISSVVLSAGSANGTLKLTVNGVAGSDVSVPGLGSFAYKNSLSASDIPSLSYLPLSGGELSGDLCLKGSSNYGRTLRFGDGNYAYISEDTDDHFKIYAANGIELSTGSGYDVTINGVPLDWFTVVTVDGSPTLKLNPRYAGLWAEGWVAAGGVGTGSGGGGISSVSLASGTNNGTLKLTVDGTVTDNIAVKGLGSLAYKSSLSTSDIPTLAYLPLSGGELTGDLRLKGSTNYGRRLRFGDGDYAYLHEDTDDHLTIFADRGISLSANSNYGIETDNFIDIGNARLIFDEGTNALHVTKKSGTSATIGLYADGFVAAGGVSGQTTMSYVDLESNQEIGGNKTFNGDFSVEGSAYFDMGIALSGDISIDGIVISTGTVEHSTVLDIVANAQFSWTEGSVLKTVTIKNLLDRIVALENA